MKTFAFTVLVVCLSGAAQVTASEYLIYPSCFRPEPHVLMESESITDGEREQLRTYKACLNRFIEQKQEEILTLERSMFEALRAWRQVDVNLASKSESKS